MRVFFFVLFLYILIPLPVLAWEYDGEIKFSVKDLPRFEEFEDGVYPATTRADDIDFDNSIEGAWNFRTRLRKALKEGPDFAGKYKIMTAGCGTSCQSNYIIDTETGRVFSGYSSRLGAEYHLDSRLIVRHAPDEESLDARYGNWGGYGVITFYEFITDPQGDLETGTLYELLTLKPPIIKWDNPKWPKYKGYP